MRFTFPITRVVKIFYSFLFKLFYPPKPTNCMLKLHLGLKFTKTIFENSSPSSLGGKIAKYSIYTKKLIYFFAVSQPSLAILSNYKIGF